MNQTTDIRAVRSREGDVYLFRYIHEGSRLIGVQYGVVKHNATSHVTWHDAENEVVDFDKIEPLFPKEKSRPKAA